jgi:hypothetical protein
MSHPGNDEIIDAKRDNLLEITGLDPKRLTQIEKMVDSATEMGIAVVQDIAVEVLKRKPGMSVKEFTKVLDDYLVQKKVQANNNG